MDTRELARVGGDVESTLRLLADLTTEISALESRAQEIVTALQRRPNLQRLPQLLLSLYSGITEALHGVRLTREAIRSYSVDRLRDTHARLSEVSSATETAAMEMLNGLDRSLAMIDQIESGMGEGAAGLHAQFAGLRAEVNNLYGHLQFQDIISQQLAGVSAMLGEVEGRMQQLADLFDGALAPGAAPRAPAAPADASYNPDATMHGVAERQAMIDAAFGARNGHGATAGPPAR